MTYCRLLTPALDIQAKVLGLTEDNSLQALANTETSRFSTRPRPIRAEVFVHSSDLIVLAVSEPSFARIAEQVGEFGLMGEQPYELSLVRIGADFDAASLEEVEHLVHAEMNVDLEPWTPESKRFKELLDEGREPPSPPSHADIAAALALSDRASRKLATAIKSSSGLLMSAVPKTLDQTDKDRQSEIVKSLEMTGLIVTEIVIICKKAGTQVARLPSTSDVRNLDSQGVKCSCGEMFTEERHEQALFVTPRAIDLLDGSRWSTIYLVKELLDMGVPVTDILIDQESGADEMDCIAVLSGDLVLFELKDKQFDLRNAYSFGAKIGIVQPDVSVIITTDRVGSDVKTHFQKTTRAGYVKRKRGTAESSPNGNAGEPVYIEGIHNLRAGLEEIMTRVTVGDAAEVLRDTLPLASLSPKAVLDAWDRRTSTRV